MFDGLLLGMLGIATLLAALAYWRGGSELLLAGLGRGGGHLTRYALLLVVSFGVAGLVEVLIPHAWVAANLGAEAGLRGILLGTAAGAVTPAGPFIAMPIAAVLVRSGASTPAVVAFLTSWSLLALHRFVAWELPLLGTRLAVLRYAVSLALPLLAGLLARALSRA
jgi:uncharacterized membrane protein YraQ (UPF0718 family)